MSRPRPVMTAAGISGAVTSIAGVLTFLGYDAASAHLSAETSTIVSVAIGVVALGSHLLAGLHAQARVTPVDQPQDHDGTPLARIDQASIVTTFDGATRPALATPLAPAVVDVEPMDDV